MTNSTDPNQLSVKTALAAPTIKPKLLLVDDQVINIQVLHEVLGEDYQLFQATSGEQAIKVCLSKKPDLVLLDMIMPGMDGNEVCRRLHDNPETQSIPVIFVTANNDEESETQALNLGAVDFISKPIKPNIVRARVKTHLTLLEQKRALQNSDQYTHAILDNAIDVILTCDTMGNIASANRAIENSFGYPFDELKKHTIHDIITIPYHDQINQILSGASILAPSEHRVEKREMEAIHFDGHHVPIEIAISMSRHDGQAMIVVMIRDISERRRVEKMKTDFISTVSHELRTPITSISGALGLLVGGAMGTIPDKVRPMIDVAHKNSLRLSYLINDILDMEKMLAGKMEFNLQKQALAPMVESAVEATLPYAQNYHVNLNINNEQDDMLVNVDHNRLHQVLVNLLSNAAKFSHPNGCVEVTISRSNSTARVAVTDHGCGIPLEYQNKIFQKFSQVDSSDTRTKGGTGLGLAIAREMMIRMNGEIGFSSARDEGSCFHIELPINA